MKLQLHGRRELTQQRQHRRLGTPWQTRQRPALLGLFEHQQALLQLLASGIQHTEANRNGHRLLLALPRRGWGELRQRQRQLASSTIPMGLQAELRRSCLVVPAAEGLQRNTRSLFQRLNKLLAGRGLTIVAPQIKLNPL